MGEDLFWAIRGGVGASFGVITAWKVRLVLVPEIVTIFSVNRTLKENATDLIYKWQSVAPSFAKELYITASLSRINPRKTIFATSFLMFLATKDKLLEILQEKFPELGEESKDCKEVSWVQSVLFFGGYDVKISPQVLASKTPLTRLYFKAKSDFVKDPISKSGIEGMWKLLRDKEAIGAVNCDRWIFTLPYGGRMGEISESAIPFPHRAGNLYKIQYLVYWDEPGRNTSKRYISWIRRLRRYIWFVMCPNFQDVHMLMFSQIFIDSDVAC